MSVVLYHHPYTRAATVVWMLEEVAVPYEPRCVDFGKGEQKGEGVRSLDPMGELPVLVDGDAVVTETASIGLYLADQYTPGRLEPALDDPTRGAFLRWCFSAPSVVEPGCLAHAAKWEFRPGQAGWGTWEELLAIAVERSLER